MNALNLIHTRGCRRVLLLASLVLLVGGALSAYAQAGDPSIEARYTTGVRDRNTGVTTVDKDGFRAPPLPLDVMIDIEPGSTLDNQGIWMYGDETGKVRVRVETVRDRLEGRGGAQLFWSQIYQKNSDLDRPRYVVNPTILEYFIGREASFYFAVFSECYASLEAARTSRYKGQRQAISQHTRIGQRLGDDEYFHSRGKLNSVDVSPGPLPIDEQLIIPNGSRSDAVVRRTTESFRGQIDIGDCGVGEYYKVIYVLQASAVDEGAESGALAFLGDPLEIDTGFALEPAGAEDEGPPGQFCRSGLNTQRFVDGLDGTVTDTETSLVWQRCPVGYVLNDGGTSDELGDDVCVPDTTTQMHWQVALTVADGHSFAGETDWRLPNVKELDSLTELDCIGPAIAPGLFPDTPRDRFWTSTPDANLDQGVKVIDAHQGDIVGVDAKSSNFARLVRDSGAAPLAPPVRVTLKSAPAAEEGDGNLRFVVTLSRAADVDTTIDYTTRDASAVVGEDYVATTGTLVVPPGALSADILVPITDDDVAEEHERVELELLGASANAWISNAVAGGDIRDDEPRVTIANLPQYEGDAGDTTDIVFVATLSQPSATDVSFEVRLSDGTATIVDNDYLPQSTTITVPAGQSQSVFVMRALGDARPEGDEFVNLEALPPIADNALLLTPTVAGVILDDEIAPMVDLNDSGADNCTNDTLVETTCPQAGYPGQDAEFGYDFTANDDSDGHAGLILTKIDGTGAALPDQSVDFETTPWDCVVDDITERMWEVKTNDGGLRDRAWLYSWYSKRGFNDGGDPGTDSGGTCAAGVLCDTDGYVGAVNAAGLCGYSNWRIPTREELLSLDISVAGGSGIDDNYFPFARASLLNLWWSSNPAVHFDLAQTEFRNDYAWHARIFDEVSLLTSPKSTPMHIRLVRDVN